MLAKQGTRYVRGLVATVAEPPLGMTVVEKDNAEALAVEALRFLASDAARLVRFLDLSGLNPNSIRSAARDPGFLAGVLEYVNADEALLIAFADLAGIKPSAVERARSVLGGRGWERDVP
jgi:hypothetical protein